MKNYLPFIFIILILSGTHVSAQTISMSADSVTILLCRQWEQSYVLFGGQKIATTPESMKVYHDYKPNHTLLISNNKDSTKIKGTWNYDPKNKVIVLMINGKHDIIVSLTDGEYVQEIETAKGAPETKIVYKPKAI
jgi:hypothetical protein